MRPGEYLSKVKDLDEALKVPKHFGLEEIKRCITLCKSVIDEIRIVLKEYVFSDIPEEIHFFKMVEPEFIGRLYYYRRVFEIESNMPIASLDGQLAYLHNQVDLLDQYFAKIQPFVSYVQSGDTYNDERYYTRRKVDVVMLPDMEIVALDEQFSTPYVILRAKIYGGYKLHDFLAKKMQALENGYTLTNSLTSPLKWKGTKVNLVVLMYGLIETGQVDCDISTLANQLQKLFDIELKDTYRIWADIKTRKKDLFPWLKEMVEKLEDRARE